MSGITRLEWAVTAAVVVVLGVLVVLEPDILEAPFENGRTLLFTFGGTAVALLAFAAMLRWHVPAVVRVLVLGVPLVAVSWWLLSPYFVDDVAHDEFAVTIAEASAETAAPTTSTTTTITTSTSVGASMPATSVVVAGAAPTSVAPPDSTPAATASPGTVAPSGPVLLGAGRFAGLAGHEGTGDAGIFRLDDGTHVLRFENFDIQNGPDLRLYVVPGADQTAPGDSSVYLGELRGNVGDQTYELPADYVPSGEVTVLVWCEAFSVEFVAATVAIV